MKHELHNLFLCSKNTNQTFGNLFYVFKLNLLPINIINYLLIMQYLIQFNLINLIFTKMYRLCFGIHTQTIVKYII